MTTTVVGGMTAVITEVFGWLQSSITSVLALFYTNGEFTFLGVTLIVSLAISIFFLLVGVISNFIHLRG